MSHTLLHNEILVSKQLALKPSLRYAVGFSPQLSLPHRASRQFLRMSSLKSHPQDDVRQPNPGRVGKSLHLSKTLIRVPDQGRHADGARRGALQDAGDGGGRGVGDVRHSPVGGCAAGGGPPGLLHRHVGPPDTLLERLCQGLQRMNVEYIGQVYGVRYQVVLVGGEVGGLGRGGASGL